MDNKKKAKECWKNATFKYWWWNEHPYAIDNPYSDCPHCTKYDCVDCEVQIACIEYTNIRNHFFTMFILYDNDMDYLLALAQFCYEKWKGWK